MFGSETSCRVFFSIGIDARSSSTGTDAQSNSWEKSAGPKCTAATTALGMWAGSHVFFLLAGVPPLWLTDTQAPAGMLLLFSSRGSPGSGRFQPGGKPRWEAIGVRVDRFSPLE